MIDMVDVATVGMAIIPAGIEVVLKVCLLRARRTATCSGPAAFVRNWANRDGRRPPAPLRPIETARGVRPKLRKPQLKNYYLPFFPFSSFSSSPCSQMQAYSALGQLGHFVMLRLNRALTGLAFASVLICTTVG